MSDFIGGALEVSHYKNHNFKVRFEGRHVAGISRISALRRTTEVIESREGAEPGGVTKSPGLTRCDPIVLERGVSHDPAFEQWASKIWSPDGHGPPANFRRDLEIELVNKNGDALWRFRVHRCWVSEFQALPGLDSTNGSILLEHVTLQNEGWERDTTVQEPFDPSMVRVLE